MTLSVQVYSALNEVIIYTTKDCKFNFNIHGTTTTMVLQVMLPVIRISYSCYRFNQTHLFRFNYFKNDAKACLLQSSHRLILYDLTT
jgi:hypothetical protein